MRIKLEKKSSLPSYQDYLDVFIATGINRFTLTLDEKEKIDLVDRWISLAKKQGTSIYHSKMIGTVENLNRISYKKPDVLYLRDKQGRTPLAYAAWSGDVEVLNWIRTHIIKAPFLRDYDGRTLDHYAAWSGKKEALDWIFMRDPKALERSDTSGRTPIHYVAMSGEAHTLNHALSLTATPQSWALFKSFDHTISDTLVEALKSNQTLTHLSFNKFNMDKASRAKIMKYLARNKEIQLLKIQFSVFMQGLLQANNPISILNLGELEICSLILSFLMPKNTNTVPIIKDIVTRSDKQQRVLALIHQEIQRLTISNEQNNTCLGFSTNSEYQCSNAKIKALHELKSIIESNEPDLMSQLIVWEEQNQITLACQRVTVSNFFCDTLTKTEVLFQNIKNILEVEPRNETDVDSEEPFVLLY